MADALDGLLKPEDEATFSAHMAVCPACTALFEEARRGREWLEFLSPEPEVPAGLLDKILAQTGPGQVAGYGLVTGGGNVLPMPPAWQRPGFMARIRRFAEPRLLMTAAMAFFSIALTLNLTGVRLSDLRLCRSAAHRGALLHGAAADHGFDADHPLLRPPAPGLRGAVEDAGAAPGDAGRRQGENQQQPNDAQPPRRASPNRIPATRMAARAWTLRSSPAHQPRDSTIWRQLFVNDSDF